MKSPRHMAILLHLLRHGKTTAQQLAEKFEVSTRTIRRDIESLSMAGVPISAARGGSGGVSIMEGYTVPRALLDDEDRKTLTALLSSFRQNADIGASGVLDKLGAVLGSAEPEWLRVDLSGWDMRTESHFAALRDAIRGGRIVRFAYISRHDGTEQIFTVEPMTLFFRGTAWYLWGYNVSLNDFAMFRLSRMLQLAETGNTFARRPQEMADTDTNWPAPTTPPIRLRFPPQVRRRVYDEFGAAAVTTHTDGFMEVTVHWQLDEWVLGTLLSYGADVTIISPDILRLALAEAGERIAEHHRKIFSAEKNE